MSTQMSLNMAKLHVLLLFLFVMSVMGRHFHPRSIVRLEEIGMDGIKEKEFSEIDGVPIDVIRNLKPTRFVPINNVLFFSSLEPCEEGFKRDLLGVCREVWD